MVTRLNDLVPNLAIKSFLYGAPKTGKTVFAGTAPTPLFFDLDEGVASCLSAGLNPAVVQPKNYAEFIESLQKLEQADPFGVVLDGEVFDTIVVDSLTSLYRAIIMQALTLPVDKKVSAMKFGQGKEQGEPREFPVLQDYGIVNERMKIVLYNLRKFRCHQVIIAHEQIRQVELTKELKGMPALTESLAAQLPSYYDLFIRMRSEPGEKGKLRFFVQTVKSGDFDAGERFNRLDPEEVANYTEIIRKCKGFIRPEPTANGEEFVR